jgi:hypothetical protein
MISTKEERIEKARKLLTTLLGGVEEFYTNKKPKTLPSGVNYSNREWLILRDVMSRVVYINHRDVSIKLLFDLEEMENKYQDLLFMAKLQS